MPRVRRGPSMPGLVRVQVEPRQAELAPGATAQLQVRIVNGTGIVDQFTVVVVGVDERLTPSPEQVSLLPNRESTVQVTLAVPREQPPPAGTRVIGVKVTSVADPSVASVEEVALTISAVPAATLSVEPQRVRGGRSGRFMVGVANRGNLTLRMGLRREDPEQAVRFRFAPPTLDVPLDGRARATLQVSASRPLMGPAVQRVLTIHAESDPVQLTGTVTFLQRSRVASGMLRALAGVAGVAVIGGAILGASLIMNSSKTKALVPTTAAGGTGPGPVTTTTVGASATTRPATTASLPSTGPPPASTSPATPTTATGPTTPTSATSPTGSTDLSDIQPQDCLPYAPASLRIVDEGASGWLLTDGFSRMNVLNNQADAQAALAMTQRHTAQCFIGRDNTRPNRADYIVEYWSGDSGRQTAIGQQDCIRYSTSTLSIVNEGTSGWLLTDGASRMLILDNQQDASN